MITWKYNNLNFVPQWAWKIDSIMSTTNPKYLIYSDMSTNAINYSILIHLQCELASNCPSSSSDATDAAAP